jgi:hypothetical protein
LVDDYFGNREAQTETVVVHGLTVARLLGEHAQILLRYAYSGVLNMYIELFSDIFKLHCDNDAPLVGKLAALPIKLSTTYFICF